MKKSPLLAAKGLLQTYCTWLEAHAKSQADFLLLGLGPLFLVALVLWLLPLSIAKVGACILAAPALAVAFVVLRAFAVRSVSK